jgi:hypothetical protein
VPGFNVSVTETIYTRLLLSVAPSVSLPTTALSGVPVPAVLMSPYDTTCMHSALHCSTECVDVDTLVINWLYQQTGASSWIVETLPLNSSGLTFNTTGHFSVQIEVCNGVSDLMTPTVEQVGPHACTLHTHPITDLRIQSGRIVSGYRVSVQRQHRDHVAATVGRESRAGECADQLYGLLYERYSTGLTLRHSTHLFTGSVNQLYYEAVNILDPTAVIRRVNITSLVFQLKFPSVGVWNVSGACVCVYPHGMLCVV